MGTTTIRLVGRDGALATTGAALADALAGSGSVLLVTGEPGIGKSAVLGEQARRATAEGVRVLRGVGWEGAGAPPYWLWTQVLRGLAPGEWGDAARLLEAETTAIAEIAEAAEAAEARFRLFDAVATALARAAPVLVLLDDLHWADDRSLRLLEFLRRALATEPVMLLGAYRDGEAGPALRALAGTAPIVPLAGLDADAVATLMAAVAGPVPDTGLAAVVHRRCGGNPLFVRELTRLMVAHGTWSDGVDPAPEGVRDTLRQRLIRLSPPCTALLELAAVAGSDIVPDMLARAGAGEVGTVVEVLEEAVRARVLVVTSTGCRFAHDLYRETVLAGVPAARRAELHGALGRALVAMSAEGADPAAVGGAAAVAAHFVAAGPPCAAEALRWSVRAAGEATRRLGHEDAARHYATALDLLRHVEAGAARRIELLLGLAAARDRSGDPAGTRDAYLRAADLARGSPDPAALAEAALGVAALGARSGTDDAVAVALLSEAADVVAGSGLAVLRSRVLAAQARALRHGATGAVDPRAEAAADEAVALAGDHGDPAALAHALLARHDVVWQPGTASRRLPILAGMAAAAQRAGDDDLVAEAVLLRATALIEHGDPKGMAELARYTRLADQLGHARGRWGALSRRATLAAMSGRVEEAVASASAAREVGDAVGLPDALGVFGTLRASLPAVGGPVLPIRDLLPVADPLWPVYPILAALGHVYAGELADAATELTGFSVHAVPEQYDLEILTAAAVVFAAVGSTEQRDWAYRCLAPHAGLHCVVGGCAAYHGVVDQHLGVLAAALGRTGHAIAHHTAAVARHEQLGTVAWAAPSRAALVALDRPAPPSAATFRPAGGTWHLAFDGREVHVPDAKGMRDIAALLAAPHRPVHVFTLLGRTAPAPVADRVLDRRAVAEVRSRLAALDEEIDDATAVRDPDRGARARAEREALVGALRTATGLGGRPRRLGDETERARKTVTARIRDTLRRIDLTHPELARHLRASVRTGTHCSYVPDEPCHWSL